MVFRDFEKADKFTKLGVEGRQQDNNHLQEKKTLIREALRQRADRDDLHFLDQ